MEFVSFFYFCFFFSSRRRHTRSYGDWSSDVCSSDLGGIVPGDQIGNRQLDFEVPPELQDRRILHAAEPLQDRECRSEERRVGKSVDLGGRRISKKKKKKC